MHPVLSVAVVALLSAAATTVDECSDRSQGQRLSVDVAGCDTPPCILKKNTNATFQITFIPDRDVAMVSNRVYARVWGIPLPFFGVDGETSCDNIYLPSGDKAGCPLHANQKYLYKNSFEIRSLYPSISPLVHWGLLDHGSGENVVCFEVKSSIES